MSEFDIPWPISSNPGRKPQEGTGRLINVFAEPRGDKSPVWKRAPGAVVFARTPSSGSANIDFDANARSAGNLFSTFFELVGSSTTQHASSGSVSVTYPTGTTDNDLLLLAYANDAVTNPTTPTGWTELGTSVSFMASALWYKFSTGESSVSFTAPDGVGVALLSVIRGVSTASPIADSAAQSTGASLDPVPPNITATTANSLLVNVSYQDDDAATAVVAPSTITIAGTTAFGFGGHLFAVSTGAAGTAAASVMMGFRPLATTGAITASTWAVTNGDDEWKSVSFTLRPD